MIQSIPNGEIEYLVIGEGIPLLIFHGASGSYDQGFLMENFVKKKDADADVDFSHASNIIEKCKSTEFYESQGLGHLVWLGSDRNQMYTKLFHFIEQHSSNDL